MEGGGSVVRLGVVCSCCFLLSGATENKHAECSVIFGTSFFWSS